jgi:DNA-binding cell septation regulator SpoVG
MENNKNMQTNDVAIEANPINLSVTVRLVEPKNNLLAFARIVINDAFLVDDITVVQGKNGIFAGMPSKPTPGKEGGYRGNSKTHYE